MNKKITKLLSVFVLAGVIGTGAAFSAAGCSPKKDDDNQQTQTTEYTVTYNANGHGTAPAAAETVDGKVTEPTAPTEAGYVFGGWYTDAECTTAFDFTATVTANTTVYAKWTEVDLWADAVDESGDPIADVLGTAAQVEAPKVVEKTGDGPAVQEGKIDIESELVVSDLTAGKTGYTDGTFTVVEGTEIRNRNKSKVYEGTTLVDEDFTATKSVKLNKTFLEVNAPAAGTLILYAQNGSSGADTVQTLNITKPDATETTLDYPVDNVQKITIPIEAPGVYRFTCAGTTDVYYAKLTFQADNTPIESISIANTGKTEYLVGQQLDCTDIIVTQTHETTGMILPVATENLTVDTSAYDATKPGVYTIGVSYTVAGNLTSETTTFETSYDVKVYGYSDLSLGMNKIIKADTNSAAGNSVYANHAVRRHYTTGDAFSPDGLSVTAVGELYGEKHDFILEDTEYTIAPVSTETVGTKYVKVSYEANGLKKTRSFDIYVAPAYSEVATLNEVNLSVDSAYAGRIGDKKEGVYNFKTIQQAIDFLNNSGVKAEAKKTINLAAGTYAEKIEINVPNLTIKGAAKETTIIEWDSLYGIKDESGFDHVTDSTATLNVRDGAVNFKLTGVTVNNKYCTQEYFDMKFPAKYGEHRALAVLIQADKVVIDDCILNGYQDTIELFTGRQVISNTLITGTTDFIFGTNNTTYFYKCEIKSISTYDNSHGGYITAFKGLNKGSDKDKIKYGAIFDDCDFTAEEGVAEGKTAIGRTWGADAAVMVMNSRLGAHISKGTDGKRDARYVKMNGDPKKAQFTEYNNTGDGAITESITGVTVLTAEQAAPYNTLATIFGTTNGLVTYADVWEITVE